MHVYDWLLALIVLLPILYIGVAVLAAYANTDRRLSRKAFTVRVVALAVVWLAFFMSGPVDVFEGPGRLHAAISMAVLQVLPAVVVYVIYLMCARGQPSATASPI